MTIPQLLTIWTIPLTNANPYVGEEHYALMDKHTHRFLDENFKETNSLGYWTHNYENLEKIKPDNAVVVSNKLASRDSKYSMEILCMLGFINDKQEGYTWTKFEAPDFIIQKEGKREYLEVTSTTSSNTWRIGTKKYLKMAKNVPIEDSIKVVRNQISKIMNKKSAKIKNYINNTDCSEGYLVIHLSSLTYHLMNIRKHKIDIKNIMPINNTRFKEVFWIDALGNTGYLFNQEI